MVALCLGATREGAWGYRFGMCVDKFGVSWMVNIAGAQSLAPTTCARPLSTEGRATIRSGAMRTIARWVSIG